MRWFWIDRFEEFVRGQRATAIKNVTLAEEPLDEYFPGAPHYSHSLVIEGIAQTGGLLISEMGHFEKRVVLAKVSRATFHRLVYPGDQLTLKVELESMHPSGAIVHGKTWIGSELHGELEVWFAVLDSSFGEGAFFPPAHLMRWLRILRLYDVAVDDQGRPLQPPAALLEAERTATT